VDDDTLAYLAIMRLQRAYADIATRHAWQEVTSIATPDAQFTFDTHSGTLFEVEGAAEFGEFGVRMTQGFSFYEYIPLNFVVTFESDHNARGRSYSLEVTENRETGDWTEFYGVYQDEYAVFEGSWRFARRRYQTYGRRTNARLEAFPLDVG
jgi:hypothetical protein